MSKNLNAVFRNLPAPSVPRSLQNLSHSVTTSMNVGYLYPINWEEVLPGDTFNVKATQVSRLTSTFIKPVMDNLYLDVYHFYVPYTQIYDKAKDIFAIARPSQYSDDEYAVMPSTYGEVYSGTIADYLGLPLGPIVNREGMNVSLAPFRSFAHIYNHWFRNQNVTDEVLVQTGDFVSSEIINNSSFAPNNYMGKPPKVNKYKDYFTSALPQPQKGEPATIPLAGEDGYVPVLALPDAHIISGSGYSSLKSYSPGSSIGAQVQMTTLASQLYTQARGDYNDQEIVGAKGLNKTDSANLGSLAGFVPSNLYADMNAVAANLNDLRFAEAYQHELELNAMYGSRYNEYLLSHYGIHSDDLEIGIPQYLGGSRTPLNITQVAQTTNGNVDSDGMTDSPLGNVGAYSWSVGDSVFKKRFKYHGIVMTVACLRYRHTYQQGIASKWHKLTKDDFYNPSFAYIGMQPIYSKEIYSKGNDPYRIFGYKPAWNEYRFSFNTITGEARSHLGSTLSQPYYGLDNSLDVWHFADEYSNTPTLTDNFVQENNEFFDRTISVKSPAQDNFLLNFYFDILAKRPITEFSMPSINVRRW